jgi:hypothetical protein
MVVMTVVVLVMVVVMIVFFWVLALCGQIAKCQYLELTCPYNAKPHKKTTIKTDIVHPMGKRYTSTFLSVKFHTISTPPVYQICISPAEL